MGREDKKRGWEEDGGDRMGREGAYRAQLTGTGLLKSIETVARPLC